MLTCAFTDKAFPASPFARIMDAKSRHQETGVTPKERKERMKIVSVCACTVGIAHTYMAKDAIEKEAKKRGWECKVEAQGGYGTEDELEDDEIAAADAVLLAIAVGITGDDRFDEKRAEGKVITMDPSDVLHDVTAVFNQVAEMCGEPVVETAQEAAAQEAVVEAAIKSAGPEAGPAVAQAVQEVTSPGEAAAAAIAEEPKKAKGLFDNFAKDLVKAFNTGVSYFIPIVVIGGVFLAFSLASGQAGDSGMEVTNPIMQSLNTIGMAGISMMIPVLAAYIAYSLAGKPALAPGFVLGYLANNPVTTPILNEAGEAVSVSTGFLGAMLMGVAAGYFINWMKTWKVNDTIRTIMPILIMPLFSTLCLGMLYIYVLAYPIGMFMNWLTALLASLSGGSAIILGIAIGIMTAIDMGGPINKTASTFTMAMMTAGVYGPNGAFRVAVAIPPLACGLATILARNKFDKADQQMGLSAIFMGLIGITEGAIPFAVKDFAHTAPALCIGSAVGAALAMAQGVECFVPHGGMIVALATNNVALYTLDMAIGTAVATAILIAMKPKLEQ